MKYYHYAEKGKTFGPFTIEELKQKRLKKETLVWTEGMADWQAAENVDELKEILIAAPPPIRKEKIQNQKPSKKVDITIYKNSGALFLGITLLIFSLISFAILNSKDGYETIEDHSLTLLIARIVICFIVVDLASSQKRNSFMWGVFAFLFPAITLIILGLMENKIEKFDEKFASIWCAKANGYYINGKYETAVDILSQLINLTNSPEAIELRAKIYFELNEYEKAKSDLDRLIEESKLLSSAYYYLGNIEENKGNINNAIFYWQKANSEDFVSFYSDKALKKLTEYQK